MTSTSRVLKLVNKHSQKVSNQRKIRGKLVNAYYIFIVKTNGQGKFIERRNKQKICISRGYLVQTFLLENQKWILHIQNIEIKNKKQVKNLRI